MMYGSWDLERDRHNFLSFWTIFCPFTPPPYGPRKSKFWKNWKKYLKISLYHVTNVYHKWQSYDVWFMRHGVQQTYFFVILDCFLPFYPPNNPKSQNFEKMKREPGDIIFWHRCTINGNHVMFGSWDTKRDRQNFLSFWTIFCPFTLLRTRKIEILKKWKKFLEISSFYIWVP